jgi:hypothetical protein
LSLNFFTMLFSRFLVLLRGAATDRRLLCLAAAPSALQQLGKLIL